MEVNNRKDSRPVVDKICIQCGKHYYTRTKLRVLCSGKCSREYSKSKSYEDVCTVSKGAAAELAVAADLLLKGWQVFRTVSQTSFCDLIAVKGDKTRYIEVRCVSTTPSGNHSYFRGLSDRKERATEIAAYVIESKEIVYMVID